MSAPGTVSVTLDGLWTSCDKPDVPLGTVRRFRGEGGHRDGFDGWGCAIRREVKFSMHGKVTLTVWHGALVVQAPTRIEGEGDDALVIEQHNFGIDEALIEGAVRSLCARGRQWPEDGAP